MCRLASLWFFNVICVIGSPRWTQYSSKLQYSHKYWIGDNNLFTYSASYALANTGQYVVSLFCLKDMVLPYVQLVIWWAPRPVLQSCYLGSWPPACTIVWCYFIPGTRLCIYVSWLHKVFISSFSRLSRSLWAGSPMLQWINYFHQCGVILFVQ